MLRRGNTAFVLHPRGRGAQPGPHCAAKPVHLARQALDLASGLIHLLLSLAQGLVVPVGGVRQVRVLRRGWQLGGERARWALPPQRPTLPGPPKPPGAPAPWTCTTLLPPAGSSPRCSRTGLGCPSAPRSARASRSPPPRRAALAGSPRSAAGLSAPVTQGKMPSSPHRSHPGRAVGSQKREETFE